ncbi:MAG: MFS transporter [Burkholderiaceae bacterium]|nr:MFS transporter [Burkholderiaceae bacterium]
MSESAQPLLAIARSHRKACALLVIMLPVLLVTIDNTILNFALPQIATALKPSAAQQLWMVDAYAFVLAGLLVTMGTTGDRVGHRTMLCLGCGGFIAVSVLIVFLTAAWHLIVGRALLGLFGAMILPATLALIRSAFDDREQRRFAVAVWATCLTIGSALGPLFGGVLLEFLSWHWIFLIAVPFLLPVLVMGPLFVPESEKQPGLTTDYPSIVLSIGALLGVMLALKQAATVGLSATVAWWAMGGIALGIAFVRRQLYLESPMLDLRPFKISAFTVSILVNLVSLGLLVGFLYFNIQMLQLVLGLAPLHASMVLVPGQVLAIGGAMLIVPVAQRVAPRYIVSTCLMVAACAFVIMGWVEARPLTIGIAFILLNVSVAALTTVSNDLVLSAVPPERVGSAASVSETAYEVDFPATMGDVGASQLDTLSGAWRVSQSLDASQSAQLIEAAGTAFAQAVSHASMSIAPFVAAVAVIAYRYLKP